MIELSVTPPVEDPALARPPDLRAAAAWRTYDDGLHEARRRGVPFLCVAEPHWTNGAQRLARELENDLVLRHALENDVVPVLVEPAERPDVWARLAWATQRQWGTFGPPLVAICAPNGHVFASRPFLEPGEHGGVPSLRSLLASAASLHLERPGAILQESRTLATPPQPRPRVPVADELGQGLEAKLDLEHGGLPETPKGTRGTLLWFALGRAADGNDVLRAWSGLTLERMARGGVRDQLDGSFHRASRDERWVKPHFEKFALDNALLAAVYARAARVLERPGFRSVALDALSFAMSAVRADAAAVASDTPYYTWLPSEMQEFEPDVVQALGLHFRITPHPSRHVLHAALEPAEMAAASYESEAELTERLLRGKALLLERRARRRPPEVIPARSIPETAHTIRWAINASVLTDAGYERELRERLEDLKPVASAYALERIACEAALGLAWSALADATGGHGSGARQRALSHAREVRREVRTVLEEEATSGSAVDAAGSLATWILDGPEPSVAGSALEVLAWAETYDDAFRDAAREAARYVSGAALEAGPAAATTLAALARLAADER